MPNSSDPVKAGKRTSWKLSVCERCRKEKSLPAEKKKSWPNKPDPNVKVTRTIPPDGEVHANCGRKGYRRAEKISHLT